MTKDEFNRNRAFLYLMEAQSFINKALHALAGGKGDINDAVWKLHDHAAKVADTFRDEILNMMDKGGNDDEYV